MQQKIVQTFIGTMSHVAVALGLGGMGLAALIQPEIVLSGFGIRRRSFPITRKKFQKIFCLLYEPTKYPRVINRVQKTISRIF